MAIRIEQKINGIENLNQPRMAMLPGLTLRSFRGEADFPEILKVILASGLVDNLERSETLADIENNYAHLFHCDPYQDMLFAEVNGEVIGYTRVWWAVEGSGNWIGFQTGNVLPDWRHKGIGNKLFDFNESRFKRIVTQLKESRQIAVDTECLLDNYVSESDIDRKNILEYRGYTPARYTFEMVRPNLDDIPDLPLPPGIEVRQVKNEHMKQIWEASNDAFRDHWGYIPDPWEEFSRFMNDADYDPTLLRVAWQGEQVAGMVLSFIDKEQNDIYHRKRGYTENICVRRPWRKHGLAKALIALSLKALKERGMTEAGLGVDAENTSGALNLYKSMGYQVVKSGTIYRKPLED